MKDRSSLGALEESGQDVGDDGQVCHHCCGQHLLKPTTNTSPHRVTFEAKPFFEFFEKAGELTVLGPSTARPGFRAPPTAGLSPRIQTKCCNIIMPKKNKNYLNILASELNLCKLCDWNNIFIIVCCSSKRWSGINAKKMYLSSDCVIQSSRL